jgi:hypothetical protein
MRNTVIFASALLGFSSLGLLHCDSSEITPPSVAPASADASPDVVLFDAGIIDPPDGAPADAGTDAARPDPTTYLADSEFADSLKINTAFPFSVTAKHPAAKGLVGVRWGRHGGPISTVTDDATGKITVTRWTLPKDIRGAASPVVVNAATPSGRPTPAYYGYDDRMVDLPFGPYGLISYTGTNAAVTGEVLLYDQDYAAVVSRAFVNSVYSVVGVSSATQRRIVYTGTSPVTASATATSQNGLWASSLCADQLAPTGACPPSTRIIAWDGFSGPVTNDIAGNVFVAAFLAGGGGDAGAPTDAIYGITRVEALSDTLLTQLPLHKATTNGTQAIAAISPEGTKSGFLVAKGREGGATAAASYAVPYVIQGQAVVRPEATLQNALESGLQSKSHSLFSDSDGDLWVYVSTDSTGYFLELRRK